MDDKGLHINALELKAAFYALRCFTDGLLNVSILLRIDNTTVIAYINKFGSVQHPHLTDIARNIWKWCEERDIHLFASYIASIDNTIADSESRIECSDTEWSLSTHAFGQVERSLGPFDIDLFASLVNAKNETYVSWFPDPGSWAIDAFSINWHPFYFYAFPPFILLPRVLRKIWDDEATGIVIISWWPSQSWFPVPTSGLEKPFPGCRETIRQALILQSVPPAALEVMIASSATIRQYARPLRIWWDFCQRHRISPFSPRVDQVLDFLSQELGNVSSYSSFNTTRSAISLISDKAIGSHPLIKRFGRGVSTVRPQHARYDFIWDPAPVIAKLAKIFPYESRPLEVISRKLVLLALGSGQRAQTLAAIKIPYIIRERDRLIIKIPDRVKTSTPGRAQPLLTFPSFSEHPELCVVTIIDHYLLRTESLRPPSAIPCSFLA
ncbi:PREDICTED: uncharacterized protein LOC108764250 [Trachymyrmex cornetzi]|uniref:uncharacterized protein LOC108764250 n=1 Tax=Trachymyrmex cornetzi TaxID=471704 RepID=UPI00084F6650|nr:PREDICTED: uncharacterized protein LOC108764250 [Trachymyrmex cornetzi]